MDVKENRFFTEFSPSAVARLADAATVREEAAGARLFEDGDAPDCLYLVLEGEVELVKGEGPAREVVLATAGPGDYFGEVAILADTGRTTGGRVKGRARLATIPKAALMAELHKEPPAVTLGLFTRVIGYLKATNERYTREVLHKEKMQFVGEMAGAILHDLRSPMTGIQLATEFLAREVASPSGQKWCALIQQQVERILQMARELLDYSRGISSLDRKPVPVAGLIERFRELNSEFIGKAGVAFETAADDAVASLDSGRMLRVLQNLVTNAVDALAGRKDGRVRLAARRSGGGIEITVEDNGPGIPEKIRERLFEPFVTHGKAHGTGLGMAVAKSLVEAHGGGIGFVTDTGAGTTFTIRLPAA